MAFRKPGFSLAAKFSILVSIPILVASSVLGYSLIKFIEKTMEMGMIDRGKGIAQMISGAAEHGILVEDYEILNNAAKNMLKGENVLYTFIRNKSGEALLSCGEIMDSIPAGTINDLPTGKERGADLNFRIAETDLLYDFTCDVLAIRDRRSREDIDMLQQGSSRMEKIGTVQVGISKANMLEYMRMVKLCIVGSTFVVTVLVIMVTVLLTRVMVKPIKRLAAAAGAIARGEFDQTVKVKSKDEIGDLAESFNRMAADLKRSSEALQYRLQMERIITTISTNFINLAPDEIDSGIYHALRTIGEFAGVDRSYVFLFSEDGKEVAKAIEWRTGETKPRIDGLKGLSTESFPWAMQKLRPSGIIHIPRVADLPPEASGERELLESYGTQSFVGVPMVYGDSLVGLLGNDSVRMEKVWMEHDITLLRMVGEIFVNTLEHIKAEKALQRQLEVEERITRELEEKTRELSKSNEELNAFVYTVSHDLKAPVVSLQGFSALLMKEYENSLDEMGMMYIDRILKNSERMGALIESLLELSRIGRMKGQEEPVNVSDMVSDVVDELSLQLKERGTKLRVKGDMPTLLCDRTRISQIFANLVSNANKFMGDDNENPTIEVGYNDRDDCHEFYVKDNGIGIDEEYHERVFQVFQRLDDINTEGTGVGLAIVRKIVETFGGKIWVDSAKGKGTTIYFTMPKAANADSGTGIEQN